MTANNACKSFLLASVIEESESITEKENKKYKKRERHLIVRPKACMTRTLEGL